MLQALAQFPKIHSLAIVSLVSTVVILAAWPSASEPVHIPLPIPETLNETTQPVAVLEQPANQTQVITIAFGDSLSTLFQQAGVSATTMFELIANKEQKRLLRAIQPGEQMAFEKDAEGTLLYFDYIKSPLLTERFTRVENAFTHQTLERSPEFVTRTATGVIDSSLFLAGQQADMPDNLTMELAQIFSWDIDFALDIRKGDRFSLIYQEKHLDGKKLGMGPILAAKFVNNGQEFVAVRFTDDKGNSDFYSPNGRSMRKAFLRTPVEFARISSHFSLKRKHPILHKIRAHKGTDYAAPAGTPIRASGDGKVIFAGTKGGFGRTLILQHGQGYTTLYAHMKSFHKNIRKGRSVKQGQTIGYVGMTGSATGPHLHYEFQVNGVPRNPVTVKLPSAEPINKKYKDAFLSHATNMVGQLEVYENSVLASANTN